MASLPDGLMAIGVVRSSRTDLAHTPVQSSLNADEIGTIELNPAYADGLDGLAEFDHAWLLTWLDRNDRRVPPPMRQVPFLLRRQPKEVGVFATRGPRRVNPLGLSLIRVVEVSGAVVRFGGVDLVDGTPVVDLKPYVSALDRPPGVQRCGWFDQITLPLGATPASLDPPGSPGGQ
jgi:tRNA-Thr(GGU) m(6)t(6)A37 methyltransferase TsaA